MAAILPLFFIDFSYFSLILSVMRFPDTHTVLCYNVTKNTFQKFFAMHDSLRHRVIYFPFLKDLPGRVTDAKSAGLKVDVIKGAETP
jgi:hypothetical protein